jgi:predicted MFS family arabinose efflux permease
MPRVSDSHLPIRKPVPLDVWRIGASGVASVIGFAALIPFGAIRLEALGHSAAEIGFFSALPWLAILVVAPFVTVLARVFGGARLYVHGAFVSIPLPLVFAFSQDYAAWCATNFVIGLIAALRWIVSEAWVADLAPPDRRGRVVGLFETFLGASFALGPVLLIALDPASDRAAYAGAALWAVGWLFSLGLASPSQPPGDGRLRERGLFSVVAALPALLVGAATGGMFEVGLAGIGSYWSLTLGLSAAAAAAFAAALGTGSFLAQYPAGWLADHARAERVTRVALVLLIAVSLAAPFLATAQAGALAVAVAWGGIGGGLYTLAMIGVGHRYSGSALLHATSAVVFAYTLGSTAGPALIGLALEAAPRHGLPLTLAALCAAALVLHVFLGPEKGGPPHPPERRP